MDALGTDISAFRTDRMMGLLKSKMARHDMSLHMRAKHPSRGGGGGKERQKKKKKVISTVKYCRYSWTKVSSGSGGKQRVDRASSLYFAKR